MSKNNMMIEFLIFSYFGITFDDAKNYDNALRASIKRAYRDASSHVLSVNNDMKDDLKDKGMKEMYSAIKKLSCNEKEYDEFHFELCKKLIELYNAADYYKDQERRFTYGVAQKWVNMAIKYIYMFNSLFNYSEFEVLVEKYKNDFHIPLDRYICKEIEELEIDVKAALGTESWSKYDEDVQKEYKNIEYNKFQEQIQKNVLKNQSPLDWEHMVWIKNSKNNSINKNN